MMLTYGIISPSLQIPQSENQGICCPEAIRVAVNATNGTADTIHLERDEKRGWEQRGAQNLSDNSGLTSVAKFSTTQSKTFSVHLTLRV